MFVKFRGWRFFWKIVTLVWLSDYYSTMFVTLKHYCVHHFAMRMLCMFVRFQWWAMCITSQQHGYAWHIATLLCLLACNTTIYSSNCKITMLITLRRQGYLHHIATIWLRLSHYNSGDIFITLWQWGYVNHMTTLLCFFNCDTTVFITLQGYYVHHFATTSLCSSQWTNIVYVCNIMMVGYVRHIVTLLWLSESNAPLFLMSQCLVFFIIREHGFMFVTWQG